MLRSKKLTMGRHGRDMGEVVGVGAHMYGSALMKRNVKQKKSEQESNREALKARPTQVHVCEKQIFLDSGRVLRNSRMCKLTSKESKSGTAD